jgi:hypothetical protein
VGRGLGAFCGKVRRCVVCAAGGHADTPLCFSMPCTHKLMFTFK